MRSAADTILSNAERHICSALGGSNICFTGRGCDESVNEDVINSSVAADQSTPTLKCNQQESQERPGMPVMFEWELKENSVRKARNPSKK